MQINPTTQQASAFGAFFGGDSAQSGGFYDIMQDAITSVEDGNNVSVSSALEEGKNKPLVESPYSRHTTDGVTYTLSEVCFTKSELAELREQLLKEGAPEESLRQFDVLASQPDGATLAQVMASLTGKTSQVNLDDNETQAITALLNQIDPSGTLSEDALGFMTQGQGEAALGLVQNALGKMAADQTIDIDPATLAALGHGLGLNQGTMNLMATALGGASLKLNGEQFNLLLDPARSQFISDAANAQKLDAALDKTLKQVIAKARNRMEKEQEASARESRRVQQSRILIDRTVQKNSREMLDETVAESEGGSRSAHAVGKAGANRSEAAQTNPSGQKLDTKNRHMGENLDGNEAGAAENSKRAVNAQFATNSDKQTFQDANKDETKNNQDAWKDLLGRVDTKPAQTNAHINTSSFVYSMLQGSQPTQSAPAANVTIQEPPMPPQQLASQAASQVENGILTAMRDGSTRMDLQLHPAELGPLSITLIARNGEVTARLRSEKTETAEILSRQLDMIRVNLEEQGVKVDKIEVQLENHQDNSQNAFGDLDQHNARQQEEARRQTLNRLRNLANLRDTDGNSLAQGLHNTGQTTTLSGNALHVVA